MAKFLQETGFKPIVPEGGYFMMVDWTPLGKYVLYNPFLHLNTLQKILIVEAKVDLSSETDQYKDYRFTKWMTKNVGLQGIPPTAFYGVEHKALGENFVRYCFIKVSAYYIYII